ncbi:MAG: dck [Gammaproteobacteria bacterium]|jgi:deoxyadenosine/deoxycytidine kinase|nr:dck [Gammaproteobacteria bacterium]
MENLRIGIIGNIGVGKSTFVKELKKTPQAKILLSSFPGQTGDEQVHTFREEFDPVVLDAFYKDPTTTAFMAQIEFLNGRLRRQEKISQARGIVLEDRTIFEDYHVFGKAQKILGHMNEEEFRAYQRSYKLLTEKIDQPDLVVYLRADTDVLLERIHKRGRDSERLISWDYLDLLNRLYEDFVRKHIRCPVLIIESNREEKLLENMEGTARRIVDKIRELNLRITTPGIHDWVRLPETDAAIRAVEAECKLENYLKKHPCLITVAGNVGLGKSTITTLMHRSLRIGALYEKPEKNPLLEKFLHDKKQYCYELQRYFLHMRAEQRRNGKNGEGSFVKDRSLAEDILIFCQLFHQDGILTADELDLLSTEFHQINRELPSSDLLIVLQGSTDQAWQRIQQRARQMEINGGWTYREINILNNLYKTYPEDVARCGYHQKPILKVDTLKLDLTNRVHMGYIFEQIYEALQ